MAYAGDEIPLIPRTVLFGNPDRVSPQISPDGKWLTYLGPRDGVMNVWIQPLDGSKPARPITDEKKAGIRIYFWSFVNDYVLYLQDKDGNENYRLYRISIASGEKACLSPNGSTRCFVAGSSPKNPKEVVVGLNDRVPELHDLYRVDVTTGKRTLLLENKGFLDFTLDDNNAIRFASRYGKDGGRDIFQYDGKQYGCFARLKPEDEMSTQFVGFDKSGKILYALDSRDRNTAALVQIDLASNKKTVLAEDGKADAEAAMIHPTERTIEAVSFQYERTHWQVIDPAIREDMNGLRRLDPGDYRVESRSLNNRMWIVSYLHDDGPTKYFLWNRDLKSGKFLFASRTGLDNLTFAKMSPVVIRARDGLELVCYLTLPPAHTPKGAGRPNKRLSMVMLVHGGPWGRDSWRFDPMHQLLANRGYAVLSVNFRGSTGFGKNFLNAGNGEWGRKMHYDLLDAADWAVNEKIADRDHIAIMGGSYGGYATLAGLTMTPDRFACGVDIVGPSNLTSLLESIPPYWKPILAMFKLRVGDPTTNEGRQLLADRSPLTFVSNIRKPLLIGQGANDPRVKQAEADQIVKAMTDKNIPVTYALFPDEGHGFARPENRTAFFAITEAFLAKHLGGRCEPLGSEDFKGSSIQVPQGASQIPQLKELLKK